MNKKEEIREEIERLVRGAMADYSRDGDEELAGRTAKYILIGLRSEDVVIKVESNNVPDKCLCNMVEGRGYPNCGVVVVKSLI